MFGIQKNTLNPALLDNPACQVGVVANGLPPLVVKPVTVIVERGPLQAGYNMTHNEIVCVFLEFSGLEILDGIRKNSDGYLTIEDAALYPALHRLQKECFLRGVWRISEKLRRAKF